jgi:hypothetical protein
MLVSISYLLSDLVLGQVEKETDAEVNYISVFIIQKMEKDLHSASAISSLTSDTLTLVNGENQIIYHFDNETNQLLRQQTGNQSEVLHSDNVLVSGYFEDLSFMDRSANVGVQLNISYVNPSNRREFRSQATTTATFELRGRK